MYVWFVRSDTTRRVDGGNPLRVSSSDGTSKVSVYGLLVSSGIQVSSDFNRYSRLRFGRVGRNGKSTFGLPSGDRCEGFGGPRRYTPGPTTRSEDKDPLTLMFEELLRGKTQTSRMV